MAIEEEKKNRAIELGVTQTGRPVSFSIDEPTHIAIQGMTRSGKSATTYYFLSELAGHRGVEIHFLDITTLLAAPFNEVGASGLSATGTRDADQYLTVLETLLKRMNSRIDELSALKRDKIQSFSPAYPLQVVVIEELPSLVCWLEDEDKVSGRKPAERNTPRFISMLRQLLAQGLKVGVMCLLIAQRFDAAVISGPARSNLGLRICLRVDDRDAVAMLFSDATSNHVDAIVSAPPGCGFLSSPTQRLAKVRLNYREYADYRSRVEACVHPNIDEHATRAQSR
ncbi:hypothetical protein G7Y29_00580 [Corynebacterium qintianiae]|uniref:FtsK domain-containing protein n=1 Tax=Corynebacterium qintianiae TaxID=2709392 RepID=A0A7T0KMR7_9CORY|nr:FtsK/SpoIIIE domain-containing protein [Corynebacterium qintianiae]QPK83362.1 hypothetical protein G7Y29_00580 [Corynebacterium qintianiae]